MAKNKNSNDKITLANYISIFGLVLLLIFTFVGHSYLSGGETGGDALTAIIITAATALLLYFLVKAKGAENELDKWRKVEYGVFVGYVLFGIITFMSCGTMQFFVVNGQKEKIKEFAKEDLEQIDSLFSKYENFERYSLAQTRSGLYNATGVVSCSDELDRFLRDNNISRDNSAFINRQDSNLLGTYRGYKKFKSDIILKNGNDIKNTVDNWNIFFIPKSAKKIDEISKRVSEQLTKYSSDAKLPLINLKNGYYDIESYQKKEFSFDESNFKFRNALRNAKASNVGSIILAVLIMLVLHIAILFSYIFGYRTRTLVGKDDEPDNRITL